MILSSALICMAMNIHFESRGEPLRGQIAVANVTMNRAKYDEGKVCKVVLKRKQFSWTTKRVKKTKKGPYVSREQVFSEPAAWAKSVVLAQLSLWGWLPKPVGEAKWFHTPQVSPSWKKDYRVVAQIGNHIFYK